MMPTARRLAFAAPLLCALAHCGGCDSVPRDAVTNCEVTTILPAAARTDILFVVDDSGSMEDDQENLGTSFQAFVDRLASSPVENDFQIGVTTTSVDYPVRLPDGSVDIQTASDGGPFEAGALVGPEGKKLLTAGPTLPADFVANVNVGTDGSPKEQGLRAAKLAVTERITNGSNAGLLRPGARLAIIIVSDEDDCSDPASPPAVVFGEGSAWCQSDDEQALLPPIADYVSALRAELAGEARDVLVAVIGAVDPDTREPEACSSQAYPATRYKAFVDAFGTNQGYIDSVCQPDFSDTLRVIAGLIDPGQRVELTETPADPRLLAVQVERDDGTKVACPVAVAGSSDAASAGTVYSEPQEGRPAALTFQGDCLLRQGDQIHVQLLCAG